MERTARLIARVAEDALRADDLEEALRRAGSQVSAALGTPVAFARSASEPDCVHAAGDVELSRAEAEVVDAVADLLGAAIGRERRVCARRIEASGRVAGAAAHDFNGLLGAIANLAELARDEVPSDGQAAADLDQIASGARSGFALTARLAALARQDAPSQDEAADVVTVVRGAATSWSRLVGPSVALRTQVSDGLGSVSLTAADLEQLLQYLVANAGEAMPDGGTLVVSAAAATLGDRPAVSLAVADTGAGMTPGIASRATDPFFTTKPLGTGDGLGLSLAHQLVTAARGTLDIVSRPTAGTTVCVRLPVQAGQAPRERDHPRGRARDTDCRGSGPC